jgi:hypothetical protein
MKKTNPYKLLNETEIKTPPDERGNFYSVKINQLGSRVIHLHLATIKSPRLIGIVLPTSRVFSVHRNRGKHLFIKNNSYGFNEHIIRTATLFDFVELIDDFGAYKIPRGELLNNGTYLDFKQIGFERQIFLGLEIIQKYKV